MEADRPGVLTLYASDESLYACKVRIALRAKGVAFRTTPRPPDYADRVPAGTIPAIDDGGFVLAESEAILEYLEETRPRPAMLAGDARARAVQRMLGRFHDTRLEPALRQTFPLVGRAGREALATPAALISERLAQLAATDRPAPLHGGATPGLADCGYAPCFAWIEALSAAFGFTVDWPPALAPYRAALAAAPPVAAEFATYPAAMARWIAARAG